jgi:invasion protein IalB
MALDLNLKKNALHRQLSIPVGIKIPVGLLRAIKETEIGEIAINPCDVGKREYKVTPLLKERATLAFNMLKWHHKRIKKGK